MNTKEAANGRWSDIYALWNIPCTPSSNRHHKCPLCEQKKFRVSDRFGNGDWICVCGHGDGISLGLQLFGESFAELAKAIDQITGRTHQGGERKPDRQAVIQSRIERLQPYVGSMSERYAQSRMLWDHPNNIFHHNKARYSKTLRMDAQIALMTDIDGRVVKVHLTYLEDGKKAALNPVRKMFSIEAYTPPSSAIMLFNHTGTLAVCEGIETSRAFTKLYKIPSWSRVNAGLLEEFKAPKGVKRLFIGGDCDANGRGQAAAWRCAHRNVLANNDVEVAYVRIPLSHGDFSGINEGQIDDRFSEDKVFKK